MATRKTPDRKAARKALLVSDFGVEAVRKSTCSLPGHHKKRSNRFSFSPFSSLGVKVSIYLNVAYLESCGHPHISITYEISACSPQLL